MTYAERTLEEVLNSVRTEEREPTYAALQNWAARFPEYQDALTDYFADWTMDIELRKAAEIDENMLANRLVSYALSIVHDQQQRAPEVKSLNTKPTRLFQAVSFIGLTIGEFAAKVRLTNEILFKMDLHRLTNIPAGCLSILQDTLKLPDAIFIPMVTGPPLSQSSSSFKSTNRPQTKTEDFLTAVKNSDLSDEDKEFWFVMTRAERTKDQGQ